MKQLIVGAALGALVSTLAGPKRRRRAGFPVKGAILGAVAALVAPKVGIQIPMLGAGAR